MKNLIILIVLLISQTTIQAQNLQAIRTYYDPYTKAHLNESYSVIAGTPTKHGLYKQYDENGVLVQEMNYVRGSRNGIKKEYYSSDYDRDSRGKIFLMCNYKNDDLDGVYEEYQYPKGLKWTKMTDTYKDGKVVKSVRYFLNGKPESISDPANIDYGYYDNGQKSKELNNKTGDFTTWYKNGKINAKGKYAGDFKIGTWYYYYESGNISLIRFSTNTGEFLSENYYHENGRMSDSIFPIQGVNQFMCIRYDSLGNKIHEIESTIKDVRSNDDPQFNGKCTKYHPSGKLWQEGGYKMGNPHGKFISYYENGKIEVIGEYYYGKKYNLWKNYDKDGTILSITKYDQYGYEIGIPRDELTEEEITKLNFKFN